MHLPFWFVVLILPVYFWPVTLAAVAGLAVLAARSRGRRRLLAAGAATILALPLIVGAGVTVNAVLEDRRFRAEYARTHAVLERETTLDGITLPAGTEVGWTDASRTRLESAVLPRETLVLGLPTRSISRVEGDWIIEAERPRRVGEWPCDAGPVTLRGEGDLLSCTLSEAVAWKGWTLPAGTGIALRREEGTLVLGLPLEASLEAREIGRPLSSLVTLNADGSLAGAFVGDDAPLPVAGVPLHGNLAWRYEAATLGLGRARPPVAVAGTRRVPGTDGDEQVVVRLPDGAVTPRPPGEE